MTSQVSGADITFEPALPGRSRVRRLARALRKRPVDFIVAFICLSMVGLAILGPSIAPHPADSANYPLLEAPSANYPFGTDNLFRDIFSRIIIGARTTLGIGFFAVFLATLASVSMGLVSGYLGGRTDLLISRVLDVMLAYPGLVFSIFFLTIFQPSFLTVSLAIALTLTPGSTRIVRSAVLGVRAQPYIEAAVSVGNTRTRIMLRHILPNVAPAIIVSASIQIGIALLAESGLSFLGLGISSPAHPSWGRMLQEMRPVWQTAWWTMVFPIAAISTAVLCFNLLGDAVRDWLDPRLRGTR